MDHFCRDDTEHAAGAWGLPGHRWNVMNSNGASSSGNAACVRAARELARRSGMKYTAALDLVTPPTQPRKPAPES
jgi:hypothetical protein